MVRENFSDDTRLVIASRAGFRCSHPQCNQLTIGPAQSPDAFENTGVACHIHAASKGGPRGQGDLSPDQIRHATNGIWMCGKHSALIDKKSGARFPVQTLQSWKALHEYRTSYEHSSKQAPFGFIRQLAVAQSPIFAPGSEIDLAKTTFIIGVNGSGKSAICEWITALDTSQNLHRWLRSDLEYTITFDAPIEHQLLVQGSQNGLRFELDRRPVSRNHVLCSTIYLRERTHPNVRSDLCRIMNLFRIEEVALRTIIGQVSSGFIRTLEFVPKDSDEDPGDITGDPPEPRYDLLCNLTRGQSVTFGRLSTGEQGRVLLEIAMSMAREAAQFGPVLLIVEIDALGMDWAAIAPYLSLFADAGCIHQTIISSWQLPTDVGMLGWQIYSIGLGIPGKRRITPLLGT